MNTKRLEVGGFDYRTGENFRRYANEWREELQAIVEKGGRVERKRKETYAYARDGKLLLEIYGRIVGEQPPPDVARSARVMTTQQETAK